MSNALAHPFPAAASKDGASQLIVSALAEKHAELDARRKLLSQQMAELDQELTHLEGAIRVFRTVGEPLPAPESLPLGDFSDFTRDDIREKALLTLLTAATPLSTSEVARAVCVKRNVSLRPFDFQRLALAVFSILRHCESRGAVREVGRAKRKAVLWRATSVPD